MHKTFLAVGIVVLLLAGCREGSSGQGASSDVVGAWIVKIPGAPFPLHMFVFHSDGTVEQSNPDSGDPNTSDSNLMGAWRADAGGYRGKLVEITADRNSHQFVARGEISFALAVTGNAFAGTASAMFYDATGQQARGPIQVKLEGQRVLP